MIEYMQIVGDITPPCWRHAHPEFKPRPDDFEKLFFKIGDTIYCCWSDEFEKALMWERLQNDKSSVFS